MKEDPELLRCFVREKSEAAFRELVQRRIDFVYGAALRQVGDVHLAEEVAQNVFLDLARKAGTLAGRPNLVSWFYTSTRFAAAKALRTRSRRAHYETEAHAMHEILSVPPTAEVNWSELRPVLDDAMHELAEKDREAILLRFFEALPLARVGVDLGLSENAARMRVDRALEKLRERLARRGITSTAVALGATIAAQPAISAPLGLAAAAAKLALAVPTVPTAVFGGGMLAAKYFVAGSVAALLGLSVHLVADNRLEARIATEAAAEEQQVVRLQTENRELRKQSAALAVEDSASDPLVQQQLARLKALAALNKSGVIGRLQWPNGGNSSLFITAEIAKLLALTPEEAAALRRDVAEAQREIAALALAEAVVRRSGDAVVVDLQPSTAIRARYAQLIGSFRRQLGPERSQYFEEVGLTAPLDALFYNFGLISMRYVVTRDPSRPEAPYGASLRKMLGANLNAPVEVSTRGGGLDRTALKERLGAMDVLVPPEF